MADASVKNTGPELRPDGVAETVSGLFSTLADAMPQIVWATDADGAHFYYNRRWYEYTGMTEADSMGFGFAIPLHPDDHERTLARWRQAWDAGEDYDIEYRFRRSDGVYRWFVGRAMPIRDVQTGEVRMWIGTCTDIDDARRAIDELSESRGRLSLALQTARLALWEYDHTAGRARGNERIAELFGTPANEWLPAETFFAAVVAEDRDEARRAFARTLAGEAGIYQARYRTRLPDGTVRHVQALATAVLGADNAVLRLTGVARDVTEESEAAEAKQRSFNALQESQGRFTVALRAAHLGTWEYELSTRELIASDETREMFGVTESGVFTLDTFTDRIHDEDRDGVLAEFGRIVDRQTDEYTVRHRVVRPDGSVRHVHASGRYYPSSDGGAGRISGVIQDVTESQTTLDALQASFNSLQDSQSKLSLALQTARLGIWEYDYATQNFEFSSRTMELFGVPDAVVPFERWAALVHAEDRAAVVAAATAIIEQAPPYEADDAVIRVRYRVRRSDNTVRHLLVMGARVFGADGKATRIAGVAQDVSEELNTLDALRESAEALRESESRFRSVVTNAPIIVFALDKNGVFTFHDGAGLTAAGRRPGFSVGRSVWEVYADFPELLEHTRRALAGETTSWRTTLRGVTYDTKATPILDENGAIDGIIGVSFDVSEQEKTERLLRDSEERFRLATETARLGVWEFGGPIERLAEWFTDPSLTAPRVDEMFRRIFGLRGDSPVSALDIIARIHPDDVAGAEPLGELHIAGKPYLDEYRVIRSSDGATRWVRSTGRLYVENNVGRFVGTVQDITEAREAEESLRESESRFRNLADNISQLAWMADETGSIFWYNQRWFDYTGSTLEEMRGWAWQIVHHPDYVHAVTEKFADHVRRGEVWEDTFPLRGADGRYRWFLSRAVPLRDPSGRIVRWFGTNTDVTDSRRAEEEVRRSEERFRSLTTATAQIVWTTRANGAFLPTQPGWAAFTGQSPDEYKGAGWLDAVHEDDRADTARLWQEAVAPHNIFMTEHRLRRADGVYRYMLARAVPVLEPDETVREWVGVHTDITERKEAEFALSEYAVKQAHVAETLQRSLLNTPPSSAFPGITVAPKYEPALDEAQVGGDFFDVFALAGGKVALVVGDVTGKGLKAAEHTGQIKYALRAFLRENPDPADALSRLNRLLTDAQTLDAPEDGDENNAMAAATVAVLELATGRLFIGGGGAEYPLVYRAKSGACEEVHASGAVVMGARAESVYEATESQLDEGDLLILTTDGITEARRERREFFGNAGVASVVESTVLRTNDPNVVATAIINAARNFSRSGTFRDDVCMLVLRKD